MTPRQVSAAEFFRKLNPSVHDAVRAKAANEGVEAVVYFENLQLDSSSLGNGTAVIVGPSCTYKSVEFVADKWLNDLPSQRQYPVIWCPATEAAIYRE